MSTDRSPPRFIATDSPNNPSTMIVKIAVNPIRDDSHGSLIRSFRALRGFYKLYHLIDVGFSRIDTHSCSQRIADDLQSPNELIARRFPDRRRFTQSSGTRPPSQSLREHRRRSAQCLPFLAKSDLLSADRLICTKPCSCVISTGYYFLAS